MFYQIDYLKNSRVHYMFMDFSTELVWSCEMLIELASRLINQLINNNLYPWGRLYSPTNYGKIPKLLLQYELWVKYFY